MDCTRFEKISWQVSDGVGHMILNDPPTNKMSLKFFTSLHNLVTQVIPNSNVKAIIIYGNGRHFSSGADLEDLLSEVACETKRNEDGDIVHYPRLLTDISKAFCFIERLSIPVIAAMRGVCIGSAFELALCCHMRICARGALLGLPESTFDLMPGCGGTQRLPALIGQGRAMRYILQGRNVTAEEAYRLGIVDMITSKKNILTCATQFAKQVADGYQKENIKHYVNQFAH